MISKTHSSSFQYVIHSIHIKIPVYPGKRIHTFFGIFGKKNQKFFRKLRRKMFLFSCFQFFRMLNLHSRCSIGLFAPFNRMPDTFFYLDQNSGNSKERIIKLQISQRFFRTPFLNVLLGTEQQTEIKYIMRRQLKQSRYSHFCLDLFWKLNISIKNNPENVLYFLILFNTRTRNLVNLIPVSATRDTFHPNRNSGSTGKKYS